MRILIGSALMIALAGTTGLAQHWPHWRGPTHDGVSLEKGLPDTWSATCASSSAFEEVASGLPPVAFAEGGPSASDERERDGQRPPGSNFEGRPLVPTVCA